MCGSSKAPLGVYCTYFPGWQVLPDLQYMAIFSQGNTRNARNKLPVAIFAAKEMHVIWAKYNSNNHNIFFKINTIFLKLKTAASFKIPNAILLAQFCYI